MSKRSNRRKRRARRRLHNKPHLAYGRLGPVRVTLIVEGKFTLNFPSVTTKWPAKHHLWPFTKMDGGPGPQSLPKNWIAV